MKTTEHPRAQTPIIDPDIEHRQTHIALSVNEPIASKDAVYIDSPGPTWKETILS
jgi:hypothetical protein